MDEQRATALLLLAEQSEDGPDEAAWFDRLEREQEDFRAALAWFLGHDRTEEALRFTAALYSFWHDRGHLEEGRQALQNALAARGGSAALRAKALHRSGMLAFRAGDEAAARASFAESLRIARHGGDTAQIATTLLGMGRLLALRQGDHATGHRLFEESLALARRGGDRRLEASAIHCLAALARLEGDRARATTLYEHSLALRRELGDPQGVAIEQLNLGFMCYHQGDIRRAADLFAESLRSSYARGDQYVMPPCLVGLAGAALKAADPSRAARLLGSVGRLLDQAGLALDPDDQAEFDQIARAARAALGDGTVNALMAEGHAMKDEQAVGYALEA